ncbi:MAG: tetratricopeptide repeat protein, partial [Thermoguttaceae bacterium]
LAMLFFLLSILWYMKAAMSTASLDIAPAADMHTFSSFIHHHSSFFFWYWLSLFSFLMAMLSKGSVAVLPVILVILIWRRRKVTIKDLARTVPFFIVGAVLVIVNVWFQTHGQEADVRTADFTERLLGAGAVVWFYLYKAILPLNLAFVYPEWRIQAGNLLWWLPLLAVLIVTAALWRYRNAWGRPFVFAWGFFCVALLPVMGFTDVYFMRFALVADHYQHISIIGLIALAAASWNCWHRQTQAQHRWMTGSAAGIAVCTLMILTWNQSGQYRDTITLYSATLKINPQCWMVQNNLGVAFFDDGKLPEAKEHFQQALNLKPKYAEPCNNLGECLLKEGRLPEAIDYFKHALRMKPGYDQAYWNLVMSYVKSNRPDEAVAAARKALDAARLQGRADLAKKIENWLNFYRPGLSPPKNVSPSAEPSSRSQ